MFELIAVILIENLPAMKTIIIYMSTHGCTERVVHELAEELSGKVTLKNLREDKRPCFHDYDRIIIGGSIRAGQIQRKIREFCETNIDQLGDKELGLFICCMSEGEEAFQQLNKAFPERLHQYARSEAVLGGEFNIEKMSFLEKIILKKISKIEETVCNIDHEAIQHFAQKMDKTFSPFLLLV